MDDRIRLLGIAPYEEMRTLMQEMAEAHEGIDLTAFVGDLQQGVELARHNFYNDYDAIISRGGTASLLREGLDLPVIEIPISSCDILRAMRLAEGVGGRCAVVGFPNVANSARELGQVLGRTVDIYPIRDAGEAEATLLSIREKGTRAILCDMVAKTTAMGLGLDVVLITSGAEGVHSAFNEALRLYGNYRHIREENRFLRGLIWNQINQTVVFNDQGELFFSTVKDNSSPIVDFLRDESRRPGPESRRHILKQIRNVQYSIRAGRESFGGTAYTTYYFSTSRIPSAEVPRGIRCLGWPEAEGQYHASLCGITGLLQDMQDRIDRINHSAQPALICGEKGTCKEQAANHIYLCGPRRDRPLVVVDCFLLGEKAWSYLLDHYDSPLAQSGCTIFVKNVDALSQDQRRQLLAAMLDMDVCKRNRLLLSCVCQRDELSSPAGRAFAEQLGCLTLYLPPARHRCAQLSAIASVYLSHLNASLTAGQVTGMAHQAMALLQAYDWPHNYTQLQRVLQELALMAEGQEISVGEVEEVLRREQAMAEATGRTQKPAEPLDLSQTLDQINREVIRRVLAEEGGNQSRSAQRLGISRTTLWRLLNRQG